MPSEDVPFMPRPDILTFEEITQVVRIFSQLGITKVRLTGGEPLVRKQLPVLIHQIASLDQIHEIALTTNGILLSRQAASLRRAGLERVNISLDSLDREQFTQITRRDELTRVLEGIQEAQRVGFEKIRINAVAVRGLIEKQIVPLASFCLENNLELRFIEFMPLNATGSWTSDDVLTGGKIRQIIEREFGTLTPIDRDNPSQPASRFVYASGKGRIGFINSVSEPFCNACDRLRLTADGKIRNCLFSHEEWDLREMLRSGATQHEIEHQIRDCVNKKKAAHGIGSPAFSKPERAMYQIGG